VLLVRQNTLTGGTLLLDHGQGVISAFFHLGRIEVREGQTLVGRTPLGCRATPASRPRRTCTGAST
jgi:hypothetical protein